MDEFVEQLKLGESLTSVVSLWSVLIGLIVSGLLAVLIGLTYRRVNAETTYSQSLVHTLVSIAMITSVIMAVVGSNIARAFSLVGALSIIRFRTAVKSPYDVTFIFFAIAVGMAAGTRFYAVAIVATVVICIAMLALRLTDFGSQSSNKEHLLYVVCDGDSDPESILDATLGRLFEAVSLAYTSVDDDDAEREVTYSVRLRPGITDSEVVNAIRDIEGVRSVSFRMIRHAVEIP